VVAKKQNIQVLDAALRRDPSLTPTTVNRYNATSTFCVDLIQKTGSFNLISRYNTSNWRCAVQARQLFRRLGCHARREKLVGTSHCPAAACSAAAAINGRIALDGAVRPPDVERSASVTRRVKRRRPESAKLRLEWNRKPNGGFGCRLRQFRKRRSFGKTLQYRLSRGCCQSARNTVTPARVSSAGHPGVAFGVGALRGDGCRMRHARQFPPLSWVRAPAFGPILAFLAV
jgi:hypothetical protein